MEFYFKIISASILTLIFLGGLVGLVYATFIVYSHLIQLKRFLKEF
jgi:hypothetical protein